MSHKSTWRTRLGIVAVLAGGFAIAHTARRHEPAKKNEVTVPSVQIVPYEVLQIAVTEDGQLVAPDDDEAAALRREMADRIGAARRAVPAPRRYDDGMLSMVVGFDQMNFLTVHRGDDGALTTDHAGESKAPAAMDDER